MQLLHQQKKDHGIHTHLHLAGCGIFQKQEIFFIIEIFRERKVYACQHQPLPVLTDGGDGGTQVSGGLWCEGWHGPQELQDCIRMIKVVEVVVLGKEGSHPVVAKN